MLRASVVTIAVLAAAAPASADVAVLMGTVQGGGMVGKGTGGDQKDEAFFANAPNGAYGLAVSGRFLFFAAEISHRQYSFVGGEDENSVRTWTQFSAGVDFEVGLGSTEQKKKRQGTFLQLSAMAGFGLGTGQQVDPPLDNGQITDKGFMLGGKLAVGTHLSSLFDLGVMVPAQYGYFFKNGVAVNDVSNHYQGLSVEALVFLRLYIKIL
jgi:hypothetical protein